MLPPKIGEGVFGSNSGGVNPTGASSFVVALSSAAAALIVLVNLRGLGLVKDTVDGCFHGTVTRSLGLGPGPERGVVVKMEAWVAMAMGISWSDKW